MGWSEVEQAFNDAVEQQVIPGATVVVRRGADVAFEGAFGFRSIEPARSPAQIETVYDLSSLTKALATTVAVMMLARDGKFRLDDRATRFFPNFGVHGKTVITFRHLLAHCSGLRGMASVLPADRRHRKKRTRQLHGELRRQGVRLRGDPSREARSAARRPKRSIPISTSSCSVRRSRRSYERRAATAFAASDFPAAGPARHRLHRHLARSARGGWSRCPTCSRPPRFAPRASGCWSARLTTRTPTRWAGSPVMPDCSLRCERSIASRRTDRVLCRDARTSCRRKYGPRILDARLDRARFDLGARMGHAIGGALQFRASFLARRGRPSRLHRHLDLDRARARLRSSMLTNRVHPGATTRRFASSARRFTT